MPSVRVKIVGASGLRSAFGDSSARSGDKADTYCTCAISGRPASGGFRTRIAEASWGPTWHHEGALQDFHPGDALCFTVLSEELLRSEDEVLGWAELTFEQVRAGFRGDVPLSGTGDRLQASLRVEVSPPQKFLAGDLARVDRRWCVVTWDRDPTRQMAGVEFLDDGSAFEVMPVSIMESAAVSAGSVFFTVTFTEISSLAHTRPPYKAACGTKVVMAGPLYEVDQTLMMPIEPQSAVALNALAPYNEVAKIAKYGPYPADREWGADFRAWQTIIVMFERQLALDARIALIQQAAHDAVSCEKKEREAGTRALHSQRLYSVVVKVKEELQHLDSSVGGPQGTGTVAWGVLASEAGPPASDAMAVRSDVPRAVEVKGETSRQRPEHDVVTSTNREMEAGAVAPTAATLQRNSSSRSATSGDAVALVSTVGEAAAQASDILAVRQEANIQELELDGVVSPSREGEAGTAASDAATPRSDPPRAMKEEVDGLALESDTAAFTRKVCEGGAEIVDTLTLRGSLLKDASLEAHSHELGRGAVISPSNEEEGRAKGEADGRGSESDAAVPAAKEGAAGQLGQLPGCHVGSGSGATADVAAAMQLPGTMEERQPTARCAKPAPAEEPTAQRIRDLAVPPTWVQGLLDAASRLDAAAESIEVEIPPRPSSNCMKQPLPVGHHAGWTSLHCWLGEAGQSSALEEGGGRPKRKPLELLHSKRWDSPPLPWPVRAPARRGCEATPPAALPPPPPRSLGIGGVCSFVGHCEPLGDCATEELLCCTPSDSDFVALPSRSNCGVVPIDRAAPFLHRQALD